MPKLRKMPKHNSTLARDLLKKWKPYNLKAISKLPVTDKEKGLMHSEMKLQASKEIKATYRKKYKEFYDEDAKRRKARRK